MIIKAEYITFGDRGESLGNGLAGYFQSEKEARKELRGLCPWDFNSMWGSSSYTDFIFKKQPGTLTDDDTEFIEETKKLLESAKNHMKDWKNSWHNRAPNNW